jgi:sarcosine oxidase subunit alpha
MLSSAAKVYANRYGVAVGKAPALMASHDSGWHDVFALAKAGMSISAIIDVRDSVDSALMREADRLGIPVYLNHGVVGVRGRHGVSSIDICNYGDQRVHRVQADALLMAGGWTPSVHLWSHSKGSLKWRDDLGAYVPDVPNENVQCVGACAGDWDFGTGAVIDMLPTPKDQSRIKAFVDFQNDVTAKDIKLAVREGFRSIEHIKSLPLRCINPSLRSGLRAFVRLTRRRHLGRWRDMPKGRYSNRHGQPISIAGRKHMARYLS